MQKNFYPLMLTLTLGMPTIFAMEPAPQNDPNEAMYVLIDKDGQDTEIDSKKITSYASSLVKMPDITPQREDGAAELVPPHGKKALGRWLKRHPEFGKEQKK